MRSSPQVAPVNPPDIVMQALSRLTNAPHALHRAWRVWLASVLTLSATLTGSVGTAAEPIFVTAAQGLVELGSTEPGWYAVELQLPESEAVFDPAAEAPGFVLVMEGDLLIEAGSTGNRTIVREAGSLFVGGGDDVTLTALDDDATVWRIAVVPSEWGDPFSSEDYADRQVDTTGIAQDGAPEGAVFAVEARIAVVQEDQEVKAGDNDSSVPLACSFDGRFEIADESVRSGPRGASGGRSRRSANGDQR